MLNFANMDTLRDISKELSDLVEIYNAEETDDAEREHVEVLLEKLDLSFELKMDSLGTLAQAYEDQAEAIAREVKRLNAWKERCQKKVDWIDGYTQHCMTLAGRDKLETSHWRYSFRASESVEISNVGEVPIEYCRHVPESYVPDKTAIKVAIKSGQEVPGAHIVGKKNLQRK